MERLGEDLSRNAEESLSPQWHEADLAKREKLIKSGKAMFIDWEVAKRQIRQQAK
jgi:hypothetical protein